MEAPVPTKPCRLEKEPFGRSVLASLHSENVPTTTKLSYFTKVTSSVKFKKKRRKVSKNRMNNLIKMCKKFGSPKNCCSMYTTCHEYHQTVLIRIRTSFLVQFQNYLLASALKAALDLANEQRAYCEYPALSKPASSERSRKTPMF